MQRYLYLDLYSLLVKAEEQRCLTFFEIMTPQTCLAQMSLPKQKEVTGQKKAI